MNPPGYEPCKCKQQGGTCGGLGRRDFLKRAAAAGAAGALATASARASADAQTALDGINGRTALDAALATWTEGLDQLGSRRFYYRNELEHIAFPLGGIGAGQVYLRGNGQLGSWQIVNNFRSGLDAPGAFFALRAVAPGKPPICRLLHRDPNNPQCAGDAVFAGEYPMAWVHLSDDALPISATMEAYSPFSPMNMKDSGLPAAVFKFYLHNNTDETVETTLLASAPNLVGWDGYSPLSKDGTAGPDFLGNENRVVEDRQSLRLSFSALSGSMPALDRPLTLKTHDVDVAYHLRLCKNLQIDLEAQEKGSDPTRVIFWFGAGSALPPESAWDDALKAVHEGARLVLIENGDGMARMISLANGHNSSMEVFEDFESGDYSNWTLEGACWGNAPAKGALPGQQPVEGYRGSGLANTFLDGDGSTGRAISKPFTISRPYIHLLVGGGAYPDATRVSLKIEGALAYSASGRSEERLTPVVWDVARYLGKEAVIEIEDKHTSGWGHINVDHIVFSDFPMPVDVDSEALRRFDEALPFSFSGVTIAETPSAIQFHGALASEKGWADSHLTAGRRCAFEGFHPHAGVCVHASTVEGEPLLFSGPCGKGLILV